jgi:4-diphosphocytidyl-2-C-methyl-D-erythritol kinase
VTIRAYAKINVGLHVLRKRQDGFHDIETIFHRINLFDEIIFEPSPTISLSSNQHNLPTDDTNLCIRAAGLLQRAFKKHNGVHITLKKNIPIGAGLGGGSSDAAAVLTALPVWWNESPEAIDHRTLALELGSDVPYFLQRGTAYATGRGEILQYFKLDLPYWIVVVYPNLHISTSWAYQNVEIKNALTSNVKPQTSNLKDTLLEHLSNPRMLMNLLHNDFEPLVLRTYPDVAKIKKALYDSGAVFAQLSGSGSSVYGFFNSEKYAKDIAETLRQQCQVFITPPHFQTETH